MEQGNQRDGHSVVPPPEPLMNTSRLLVRLLALSALSLPLAAQATVHILAEIDGRSRLILAGDTAQWQHYDFAAPGRIDCDTGYPIEPTYLEGSPWWPQWADLPDCENRDCGGCTSEVLTGLAPALPLSDYQGLLTPIQARGSVAIVEQPSSANGYRVVLEFNDNGWGGADWYEVELYAQSGLGQVTRYCLSTPNSTGLPATIGIGGSISVAANSLQLLAYQCPPSRPGIFVYGQAQAQLPFADGYLCISPFSPGLHRMGSALTLSASGAAVLPVDMSTLPPGAPIASGTTWNFQFWYRDMAAGHSGSNLSDALSVTFAP